jgi:hypothetical protein
VRGLAVILLISIAGCGAEENPAPLECSVPWQSVVPPSPSFRTGPSLVWRGGYLYFGTPGEVRRIPAAGGEMETLVKLTVGTAPFVWIVGDRLIIDEYGPLSSAPLQGGAPTALAEQFPTGVSHWALDESLDAAYFYEVLDWGSSRASATLWRLGSAPGSTREEVGEFPSMGKQYMRLTLTRDRLLLTTGSDFPTGIYALGRYGGAPVPLAASADGSDGSVLGVGPDDALLAGEVARGSPVKRVPFDGSPPVPFWTTKPVQTRPHEAWLMPGGAWLIFAFDTDMARPSPVSPSGRSTVRWVDPDGRSGVPACDTGGQIDGVAVDSQYVYIASHGGGGAIRKLSRTDLAPR